MARDDDWLPCMAIGSRGVVFGGLIRLMHCPCIGKMFGAYVKSATWLDVQQIHLC